MVRTRIAPSPTGYPHIGTIYQALFDFAFAKHHGGRFIIRIEDTDRERFVQDAEEKLYIALDWFGLTEDESQRKGGSFGPYVQSKRLVKYQTVAKELLAKDAAYYCFCTKERLEQMRKRQQEQKHPIIMYDKQCRNLSKEVIEKKLQENSAKVIRLKVPQGETIVTHDEIRGDISFDPALVDDQVLLKADGFPTYHLAVVVDDHAMQITHVVRAEEWIPSFPKHVVLYHYLGWEIPKFYHTSALRNPDKSKLSKRQGHTNVSWYQAEGYLPDAILNYIALLGWSHPQEKELFSLQEFISLFELKDIKPIGPVFDLQKLSWMNGEYIRQLTDKSFREKLQDFFANDKEVRDFFTDSTIQSDAIIALTKTRIKTLRNFKDLVIPIHPELSEKEKQIAEDLLQQLQQAGEWEKDTILAAMKKLLQVHGIKMNSVYKIMTGREKGLPLPEYLEAISKETVIQRLQQIV